jgi:hypothetical protein
MTLCLTNEKKFLLVGYPYGYPLDPYVFLSPTRGSAGGDGFWVQPFGDGSLGFIQPVRVCVCTIEFAPKCITFLVLSSAGLSMWPRCATREL